VSLFAHDQGQRSTADDLSQRWVGSIGLAAAVGLVYFLAAKFSVRLILEPSGVAVFWPAAGISAGLLIALGPRRGRRFPAGHHTGSAESDLKWLLCGD
jgi:integral membrane sensor domain MASE1